MIIGIGIRECAGILDDLSQEVLMRHRTLVEGALILLTLSTFFAFKIFVEDYGPFDGWVNFHSSEVLDRKTLGYTSPADFKGDSSSQNGIGYCVYDVPIWPLGEKGPSVARDDALPPMLTRHTIYAADPKYLLLVLGVGWIWWASALCAWIKRRARMKRRGFEVRESIF